MFEGFRYRMPEWHPFQEQAACERARRVTRADWASFKHPHLKVIILRDDEFAFRWIQEIFGQIKQAADEGRRLVLILPQPDPLYARLAFLCNRLRVSCHHLYTFNMDEYADEEGRIAPETWPNSFLYNMKVNFYGKLDPALRPPESHFQGPTDANFRDYGKMIADMGGADVCYGGIGWSGHVAYIEPGSVAFPPMPMQEWVKIGPRIVKLTPFSILQNCLGPEFGQSGDWSSVPPQGATIGPADYLAARLRSSWNGFRVGSSMVSWQRFTVRLAAFTPPTPLIPATMLQMAPSELYLSESLAAAIEPASVEEFTWY
ncbi:MAG: hypothetical protein FJ011_07335 [Chloroflexi bacterium]|nr:hypothetical protein [Chloroflexota bacterium]